MNTFYNYMLNNKYAPYTIAQHERNINRIKLWCKKQRLRLGKLNYEKLLTYADYEKKKGLNLHTINTRLNSLTHYYNYLIQQGKQANNPAKRLRIKVAPRQILKDTLTKEELESLYHTFSQQITSREPHHKKIHERDTIIISLMIYQALNSGTIKKLEPSHINLKTATIYIPGTTLSNPRTLNLEPCQILPLHQYMNELEPAAKKLFNINISARIKDLLKALKEINPKVNNAQQIRASVLVYWIKLYNKRQAQYRIGHKHISSTEEYEQQDIETLINQVNKYHPFS